MRDTHTAFETIASRSGTKHRLDVRINRHKVDAPSFFTRKASQLLSNSLKQRCHDFALNRHICHNMHTEMNLADVFEQKNAFQCIFYSIALVNLVW